MRNSKRFLVVLIGLFAAAFGSAAFAAPDLSSVTTSITGFIDGTFTTAITTIGASAVMVSIVIAGYKHLKRLF